MSNPAFVPQDDSNFTAIRYYTALDPYFYVIDNRPLQDIETNLKASRSGGADAARRAVLMSSINSAIISGAAFLPFSATRSFVGLQVVQASSTVVRILPGSVFDTEVIATGNTNTITKQATTAIKTDFTISAPTVAGTSIVYTIEGQIIDLDSTAMSTSTNPFVDSTNSFLPSTLLNGELRLFLISGIAATTGTETPAATTSGRFPIYNVTIAQGASTYSVALHTNAPTLKGLNKQTTPVPTTSGGAPVTIINNLQTSTYVAGSVTSSILPITLTEGSINPYAPIKVKVVFSPTVTGNNAAFRIRYKGFLSGELTTSALTTSTLDAIPVTVVANGVQSFVTTLAKVPTTEFASFVSGNWVINKEYLNVIFERVGGNAADTNTGSINVLAISLIQ